MEKRRSFQHVVPEQLDIHVHKVSSTDHMGFTKTNSKQIKDLSVKLKTVKFPEDAIGGTLDGLGYGDEFLDTAAKAQL